MRQILTFSIGFLLLKASFAGAPQLSDELIVQIPSATEKNIDQIRQSFISVSGVSYIGFCETEKCFFLRIDRKIVEDNSQIESLVKNLNLEFYFKTGTTIDKAIADCDLYRGILPPDPFAAPKN